MKVNADSVAISGKWPISRVVMIGAWVSDVLWLPMMYYGGSMVRTAGFIGFGISLVVWWISLSIFNRGKARERESEARSSQIARYWANIWLRFCRETG